MERAETMARLLDVGYRMSLFPNPKGYHNEWDSVLSAAGASQGYFSKYNEINQDNVEDYLFFDEENPSSVYSCISKDMLSRTAENLYWISRYMERAETMARLLDVGYRMSLFPNPKGYHNEWDSVLSAAGASQGYFSKYNEINQDNVEDYLFFDEENPSSVYSCISKARNNALLVRTAFTPEAWVALNKSYKEMLEFKKGKFIRSDLPNFTEWTIQQVNMFRGSANSLLRNDGYHFIFLGTFIERADNSARLLDVKYFVLLPTADYIGGNLDNLQWIILLRSLSSFRAFRWAYEGDVTSSKIAHFFILNNDCSRSLSFCINNIVHHLNSLKCSPNKISDIYSGLKGVHETIKNETVESIIEYGLHEYVTNFVSKISYLDNQIQDQFFG